MADKILSQDEVEALLQGVNEEELETEQKSIPDPGEVQAYDLTNQERFIRGQMPGLEIINERFARFSQASISSFMKRDIDVIPAGIEVPKFEEFMLKIPLPSSINILKMGSLRGSALLVIDSKFIYRLVDLFFGGSGQTYVKIEGRDFTTIELRILKKVLDQMLLDLEKSWKPIFPVNITSIRSEINPQFASVVAPSEVIISSAFNLEIDGEGGEIYFGIPYPTIEPIREKLYGSFQGEQNEDNTRWAECFSEQLVECPMLLTAEIGTVSLTVGEVSKLSVGDTILLNKSMKEDLEVKIEGKTIFHGKPGLHRGNVAIQIASIKKDRKEAEDDG
ncbi:MAG: flagellar motor switch protein FliM [Nitrospiria bacterium]